MTDALDHSEVDALLAAVGDGGQVWQDPRAPQVFGGRGRARVDVQVYDFKRPERVSEDGMRALEALHEGFGRNFGATLSDDLRTVIEVSVAHVEQLTCGEFVHSLPDPTCLNMLKAEQLGGQLCLEISPLVVYPIIDRLLGGSNADVFIPQRPLTQIEQRLVRRITDRATHHLSDAWSDLTPVTFRANGFESNPRLVPIVPPDETVVVVGFELRMGSRAGTMSLCIPYKVIEPILGVRAAQSRVGHQREGGQDDHLKTLARNVSNARVEVRALLAQTTITPDELMALQVGDVITTDKASERDVLVRIEGKDTFHAQVGQFRGGRIVRLTRACRHLGDNGRADEIGGKP